MIQRASTQITFTDRIMQVYLDLLAHVLENGEKANNRTGISAYAIFGEQIKIDLQKGFPLLTTKNVFFKGVVHELLWFLSGSTDIKTLVENDIHIWDNWADAHGNLGPVYGKQWRSWQAPSGDTLDQIDKVIQTIKTDPFSRRMIVSAWNVADLDDMALQPCHCLFQFAVMGGKLSCHLYQRSADIFLGVPFNIASYALLTHMIARITDLEVGYFIHSFGNLHLYENHTEQAKKQLSRTPRALPTLLLDKVSHIDDFKFEHIHLHNYDPHDKISAPIAV